MSKELFLNLLEIQGLNHKIFDHRRLIKEHLGRVEHVKEKKSDNLDRLTQLKTKLEQNKNLIGQFETELFETESQLKKTQEKISGINHLH